MKQRILTICAMMSMAATALSQTWIWYPGDYEVWLGNRMNNRRTERGAFFPPFWKSDSHYVTVEFSKKLDLKKAEKIQIAAEGRYNVKIDGKLLFGMPATIVLPEGKHSLNIKVWNQVTPPAIYVNGETVKSDSSWNVTNEDKEWIDESGKASDTSATIYMEAGFWNFNTVDTPPSKYQLQQSPMRAVEKAEKPCGTLYDFGKETFGSLVLHGVKGNGRLNVYYGESKEEAQDKEHCETLDKFEMTSSAVVDLSTGIVLERKGEDYNVTSTKAFRYVYVETEGTAEVEDISMMYEYAPETVRASFRCNDDMINKMWEISEYTLHLTTREFFIDGIKRDRWTWSGDAYQSYLMNYYLYFDSDCVKRTTWQLRGKDPVTSHINTIMDYTFYWFLGIYDYYMYTGDSRFVNQIYPRMQSLMNYVLGRTDKDGMVEGQTGDWVFVDWADGPMSKKGKLSFEQVLFCRSLETMALCAHIVGNADDEKKYQSLYNEIRSKLIPMFWDNERKALVHNVEDGKQSNQITRYANLFAIFYNYLTDEQKSEVASNVIHNDNIMKITTPYMRFYELEALCVMGEQADVLKQMKDYWGGMINLGATTFWEKYNPELNVKGASVEENLRAQLPMYGRPYGKSLCHAWGASPIYLLGRYFLGVEPTKQGYEEYTVKPVLGGLKWMDGDVPTPEGTIHVYMDKKRVTVKSDGGTGWLHLNGREPIRIPAGKEITVKR